MSRSDNQCRGENEPFIREIKRILDEFNIERERR